MDDSSWLRARRAEGWSVTRLASELGIDHRLVSAALRRTGLPIPLPVERHYPELHHVEWLTRALTELCTEDVARMVGCAPQSVRYAARKYGVTSVVNGHQLPRAVAAKLGDREWLVRRRTDGATIRQLADELGAPPARVSAASRAAGLPPIRRNGSKPTFPQLYDADWVRSQLAHKTRAQVARELGCSVRSVRDAASRAGIPPTKTQRPPSSRSGGPRRSPG